MVPSATRVVSLSPLVTWVMERMILPSEAVVMEKPRSRMDWGDDAELGGEGGEFFEEGVEAAGLCGVEAGVEMGEAFAVALDVDAWGGAFEAVMGIFDAAPALGDGVAGFDLFDLAGEFFEAEIFGAERIFCGSGEFEGGAGEGGAGGFELAAEVAGEERGLGVEMGEEG